MKYFLFLLFICKYGSAFSEVQNFSNAESSDVTNLVEVEQDPLFDETVVRSWFPCLLEAAATFLEKSSEKMVSNNRSPKNLFIATAAQFMAATYREEAKLHENENSSPNLHRSGALPQEDVPSHKVLSPDNLKIILRIFLDHLLLLASSCGDKLVDDFLEELNLKKIDNMYKDKDLQ